MRVPTRDTLKTYYRLTKPGIIYGNLLTAIGGFLFGARGDIDPAAFLGVAAGTSLIIASACVFNNYIDRDIDAFMARTKKRALVSKEITPRQALIFGSVLGIAGVMALFFLTNVPTLVLGLIGFVSYVCVYTFAKRRTVYSTVIGSISGSTPIAAGYTAATGHFDTAALILFAVMAVWQLPHFYAIGIFRKDEYAAAIVPILSVVKGTAVSKLHIIIYAVLYIFPVAALFLLGYAGYSYLAVMLGLSAYWIWLGLQGFKKNIDDMRWARKIFGHSLLILLGLSIMLSLDAWLP